MAGKQKWDRRQDRLTGQAWCTLVFKGLATVNPCVVFNPFPGCQGSSLTLQHGAQWEVGRTRVVCAVGGTCPPPHQFCPPAASGKGQLKQLNPWDKSGLEM